MTIQGNCLDILPTLEAQSVQCCVTSPPYWGLRDYGTATWEGGESGCGHVAMEKPPTIGSSSTLGYPSDGGPRRITEGNQYHNAYKAQYRDQCAKCGARRRDSQLGLEATPEEYVANMVKVFREVWRVLRDDGTLWVNIGDSYASNPASGGKQSALMTGGEHKRTPQANGYQRPLGLKPKDLCGIPWRLAFALQADGWYLRSDIIWSKPNPMPESVTDRPTKAHEYIFLLTKSATYFYDADAIREAAIPQDRMGVAVGYATPKHRRLFEQGIRVSGAPKNTLNGSSGDSRNRRTVWTVATQPYSEAHFATFPEDLIKPCIMAGSRVSDTVLDPFAGSGTTGLVATELGRKSVLIELNPAYVAMINDRTNVTIGML